MEVSVIILRGQTRQSDTHISQLQQFFALTNFRVTVMNGSIIDGLQHSKVKWPQLPCLIIKDGSIPIPGLTPELLIEHLQELQGLNPNIIHLCRWNDVCYKNISATPNWYYTRQPLEVQATIFSPGVMAAVLNIPLDLSWRTILSTEVYNPALVPKYNLFNFDSRLAVTDVDFQRVNPCQNVPDESTISGILGLILVISAIVGVLLILLISYLNNLEEDSAVPAILMGILLVLIFVGVIVALVLITGSNE